MILSENKLLFFLSINISLQEKETMYSFSDEKLMSLASFVFSLVKISFSDFGCIFLPRDSLIQKKTLKTLKTEPKYMSLGL